MSVIRSFFDLTLFLTFGGEARCRAETMGMYTGKLVFSQAMEQLPVHEFQMRDVLRRLDASLHEIS